MRFVLLIFLCVFAPVVNAQTKDRIQREAQEFRLEDVRLLDGPFKNAMTRDDAYLLRLDPDRLLSGFRKEAGSQKEYSKPFDSFWCCVGTGMENHAKYGEAIYFHSNDALWVNLFIPSELTWREKGVTLRQETRYPEDEKVTFTVKAARPVNFALRLRHPGWAERVLITINGRGQMVDLTRGSFITINRMWKTGDRVELTIPMSLRLEAMPDNPNRVAIFYGPTLLAGELEDQSKDVSLMPALITSDREPAKWLKPVAERPVTFRTVSVGRPQDFTLYPFYAMHHKRYVVYWDLN